MRKLALLMLIVVLALSSCSLLKPEKVDQDVYRAIADLVDAKAEFVSIGNMEEYLKILNPEDKELQIEQSNWMADVKQYPVDDYSLELLGIEQIDENSYKARLRQSYKRASEEYNLEYYNAYKLIHGNFYDAGNYFEELQKENITIKYTTKNKKLAEDIIDDMNELYDENIKRWGITPKRPVVIKMFEDIEELRQSIKLSMWQCAGWYEYGESIKLLINPSANSPDKIGRVVSHEMTHLFTVEKSAGNLAYWLSEGLASYYETPDNRQGPGQLYKNMRVKLLTIDEIEAIELEKLEDKQKISEYYTNAHLITAFMIEKYGEDSIIKLLEELSNYPSKVGTTSENDGYYREYLHKVLPEVLDIQDYEVFKEEWKRWEPSLALFGWLRLCSGEYAASLLEVYCEV
ncbi:MAG: hypothetical protein K0R84_733 [Clostridia bacterium]|nr:hypothetical protein [Clostridia bacterium]